MISGIARIGPALSVASTWGTSPSLSGQPSSVSLSGEHWVAPTQAEASGTNSSVAGRHGVYTPPRARAMLSPTVASGHVVPAVEKAVVLRGEDFPTLQAALPPLPIPSQQKQKDLHQKQREKQQELKAQQHKLQLLSEQHPVLKPGEVSQFPAGGGSLLWFATMFDLNMLLNSHKLSMFDCKAWETSLEFFKLGTFLMKLVTSLGGRWVSLFK